MQINPKHDTVATVIFINKELEETNKWLHFKLFLGTITRFQAKDEEYKHNQVQQFVKFAIYQDLLKEHEAFS